MHQLDKQIYIVIIISPHAVINTQLTPNEAYWVTVIFVFSKQTKKSPKA